MRSGRIGICRQLIKATILLTALTEVSAYRSTPPIKKSNLTVGIVGRGDRLLHRSYVYKAPVPHSIQMEDVIYRGHPDIRIMSIQAQEVGQTQYGRAQITSGGLNRNNTSVRFISARGWGYYYVLEIYGHDSHKSKYNRIVKL